MTYAAKIALIVVAGYALSHLAVGASPVTLERKPSSEVEAVRKLLDSWSGQGQILEQARERLARVLATAPEDYFALKEMARYRLSVGYIKSRQAQFETRSYLIATYQPGTLEKAEATIRDAIRINPEFAEGYVLLGFIQFQQSKLDEAAKSLTRAEALGTDDPWLQLNWATLNNARGEDSAAKARWLNVLRSGTSNINAQVVAYDFLIESYKRSGDSDKVVALYQDQIAISPANAWVRGAFAEYLTSTLGRNDEAIAQARLALKSMDYGWGRLILGMALYRKWADMANAGNEAESEVCFQEGLAVYPRLNNVMGYGASVPMGEGLARALVTKKGVSIDARVEDGSTALLIATNKQRVEVVRMLLDMGANPNIPDNAGWTPLLSAADEGADEIAILLLGKGADVRATLRGRDAATRAQQRGRTELAALLTRLAAELK